jgi:hypothetical protein
MTVFYFEPACKRAKDRSQIEYRGAPPGLQH